MVDHGYHHLFAILRVRMHDAASIRSWIRCCYKLITSAGSKDLLVREKRLVRIRLNARGGSSLGLHVRFNKLLATPNVNYLQVYWN